jgi:hypothetical protein
MTEASTPSPDSPDEVLASLGDLTRKVRAAQRGTWFPLLLFGVITLGGILANRFTFSIHTVPCPAGLTPPGTGTSCVLTRQGMPFYWAIGSLLAYAAIAFFYIRRSRNRGVGTPIRPYVLAGIGMAALFAATQFWTQFRGTAHVTTPSATIYFWGLHLDPNAGPTVLLERFTGPATFVGVPLLVLSWVERSRALLLFTLAYLALELAPITTGWAGIPPTSPWSSLPRLAVPAVFLLLGALGFALTQLPRQRTTS